MIRILVIVTCTLFSTAMFHAQDVFLEVHEGRLGTVRKLIDKDPDLIHAKDEIDRSLLHWACRGQNSDLIEYLILQGSDVNAQDEGAFLGQKPPGIIPEILAPGIISLPDIFEHSAAIFSPDNSVVFWSGKPPGTNSFLMPFIHKIIQHLELKKNGLIPIHQEKYNHESQTISNYFSDSHANIAILFSR